MNATYLTPVLGASIGYFTNWLAIKMIFRPHEAKYIFGLKVPFTPGLIAIERERITKQIGFVVSNDLLTEEDFKNKIINIDFNNIIKKALYTTENKIINSDITVEEFLKTIFKDDYDEKLNTIKNVFNEKLVNLTYELKTDDQIKNLENDLSCVLPDLLNIIKTILENDLYNIDVLFFEVLDYIVENVFKGVSSLIGAFIDPEKIYSTLKEKIITSIEEDNGEIQNKLFNIIEENNKQQKEQLDFENLVVLSLDKCLNTKISSFSFIISLFNTTTAINTISDILKSFLSEESTNILKQVDINEIITEKIDNMPLTEIENLILSIANKEIKAITYIGGVLGFLIGSLTLLI